MESPAYFLADLPAEATLTATTIVEAARTLKRNRHQYLSSWRTEDAIRVLAQVAREWLRTESPYRQRALAQGPAATGFSTATLARGLDTFFRGVTPEALESLVVQDLGHVQRLDQFCATEVEQLGRRTSFARGPEFVAHIAGGVLPNTVFTLMLLGVLVRSAQFVKCASGASFLPRLFAHSLYEAEPKLGACLEVAEWKGGTSSLEEALLGEADCVTVLGSDETLRALALRIPPSTRRAGYGHRVSFGYVTQEVLQSGVPRVVAARAAHDLAAWDQLGCLSPHVIYVEAGAPFSPAQFAALLASELGQLEGVQPRGTLSAADAAVITSRRQFYQVRAAHTSDTLLWASEGSTAWTVVFETDPRFQMSCLNRFVYVKPVHDAEEAVQAADAVRRHTSTVGIAALETRARALAMLFARWGASRVCELGNMQNPPLAWRHDGRPSLAELVGWSDHERLPAVINYES